MSCKHCNDIQVIVLCKEKNKIFPVEFEKLDVSILRIRSRFNVDLDYYILKIDKSKGILPEVYIETIKRHPRILEISDMIEKL